MKHQEFIETIDKKLPGIKTENRLFWNLWCLNFVFEKIADDNPYYPEFQKSFHLLWELNDSNLGLNELINDDCVKSVLKFDNDEYEALDDFDIAERAVKEYIAGFESIIGALSSGASYSANELPINLIDVIVDGIFVSKANHSEIYLNEVNAQLRLVEELKGRHSYSKKDRNIYRPSSGSKS